MFVDDAIHLVLWLVKGLCLIDYNFIKPSKKRPMIGARMLLLNSNLSASGAVTAIAVVVRQLQVFPIHSSFFFYLCAYVCLFVCLQVPCSLIESWQ